MSITDLRNSLEWALLVALVFGGGAIAQAQNEQAASSEDQQPQGKIVRIGPATDGQFTADDPVAVDDQTIEQPTQPELPKYWVGILGGPVSDALRAQVDVPAGMGILVRHVAAQSPADKAGLKVFDILLQANDAELSDVADLSELVGSEGEKGGKITLDVLRHGRHETITLTPEARPEPVAGEGPNFLGGTGWGSGGVARGGLWSMPPFDHSGQPLQFRMFGPGGAFSQQGFALSQMPAGVSVSIQKENDEPAQITVKRGNDTWDVVGDDPSSLAQLPDDVRPFVEQLLTGTGRIQMQMPAMPGMRRMPHDPGGFDNDAMQLRLHQLEQHLQQLQERLERQYGQPPIEVQPESDTD